MSRLTVAFLLIRRVALLSHVALLRTRVLRNFTPTVNKTLLYLRILTVAIIEIVKHYLYVGDIHVLIIV